MSSRSCSLIDDAFSAITEAQVLKKHRENKIPAENKIFASLNTFASFDAEVLFRILKLKSDSFSMSDVNAKEQ
jgi:hypothetical protein